MRLDIYQQKSSNLTAENRLLKFAIVVLSIGVVLNGFFTYAAMNKKTVVIVPPGLDKPVTVAGEKFDEEYIKTFAKHIGFLAYHYTAVSARSNFDELLAFYEPESFEAAKKLFYQTADAIETSGTSSIFYPEQITVDTGKRQIHIKGVRTMMLNGVVAEQGPRSFNIEFKAYNGRFYVRKVTDDTQNEASLERDKKLTADMGAKDSAKQLNTTPGQPVVKK